ncbi:hypothetical protein [Nocardia sp. BMG111209]|uniref:hypothetical protein n=1 Tax=Nocardia sp. BMG111209 TaxID=1160137 RepID=UPI00037A2D37|nr:hypothetical protein [Nocardia sp. BMG111209]
MANTLEHEFLIHLFRCNTDLAALLLRRYLGIAVPRYSTAVSGSEDATEIAPEPKVRKSDAVVIHLHEKSDRPPIWAVIIEVQRRSDTNKRWVWPLYHARIRHRYRCPTTLLVVSPTERTAEQCGRRIDTGQPKSAWSPLVTTPRRLMINYTETTGEPELAVLAAIGHANDPDMDAALDQLGTELANLAATAPKRAQAYADGVLDALTGPARDLWREKMTTSEYRYQTDFAQGYYNEGAEAGEAKGKAEAKADAILMFLRHRRVLVSDGDEQRIKSCTDLDQLDKWIACAAEVKAVDELFM